VCDEAPIAFTHVPEALMLHQGFVRAFASHPVWLQSLTRTWLATRASGGLPTTRPLPALRGGGAP
jgi:hypothetical protein